MISAMNNLFFVKKESPKKVRNIPTNALRFVTVIYIHGLTTDVFGHSCGHLQGSNKREYSNKLQGG